jgi:uncharacterized protein involved in type VI secretion and phage assembly
MGPPSTKPRNRRHRTELSRLAAEEKRRNRDAEIEALARTRMEWERRKAARVSGVADTRWTGASNAYDLSTSA